MSDRRTLARRSSHLARSVRTAALNRGSRALFGFAVELASAGADAFLRSGAAARKGHGAALALQDEVGLPVAWGSPSSRQHWLTGTSKNAWATMIRVMRCAISSRAAGRIIS